MRSAHLRFLMVTVLTGITLWGVMAWAEMTYTPSTTLGELTEIEIKPLRAFCRQLPSVRVLSDREVE